MSSELWEAVAQGDAEAVRDLLASGTDVNQRGVFDETPLHRAALNNRPDIAQLLLDNGARANLRNRDGYTPLHEAVTHGATAVLEVLIQKGADINARGWGDWTPLHLAVGKCDLGLVRALVERGGARLNLRDRTGKTPLDVNSRYDAQDVGQYLRDHGGRRSWELKWWKLWQKR
jgi:ankyrin repeat protein